MAYVAPLRRALICLVALGSAGCDGTGPEPPAPSFVRLESDGGDFIGGGGTFEYTHADAQIGVTASGGHLAITIDGDETWFGDFQVPSGMTQLLPGTYGGLQRYPFHDASKGGLSWSGEGRGCNTLTGSFTIVSVVYDAETLAAIDLTFEQHCEGGTPALRGTVHWRADDDSGPAGPVRPIPSGLWRPAAGSTPAAGDYVYLQSDAGDYIGGGQTYTYVEANETISVTASEGRLSVSVDGWSGTFQAMSTLSRLETGYYPDLNRFPFHNPAKGGLDWSGNGRGCNTLSGWFVIDRITYVGNAVTELDLRFEQHCEEGAPALHGAIRWTS